MANEEGFLKPLREKVVKSHQAGNRKYYGITCETDNVIGGSGYLEGINNRKFSVLGHFSSMGDIRVMRHIGKYILEGE